MVSEIDKEPLATESLNDETYPGLTIFEMTQAQRDAVDSAIKNYHLSPIVSEEEVDEDDDKYSDISSEDESIPETTERADKKVSEVNTIIEQPRISPVTVIPETNYNTYNNSYSSYSSLATKNDKLDNQHISTIATLPTPNIFSKITDERLVEELKEEVTQLRKKVAMSANMKSFIARLNGTEDVSYQVEIIKSYSKRRFNIIISTEDFDALPQDQITAMYKKTRESEKSDKFELIYKTIFDFSVSSIEHMLNKYFFKVEHLSDYLVYDDISHELIDMKQSVESTVIGRYVDNTSPIIRIISYLAIQITRAKLKV